MQQRGPFETADGERFIVGLQRQDQWVSCRTCAIALQPRQVVVFRGDQVFCLKCGDTEAGVRRIRAGRKDPEGDRILSSTRMGRIHWRRRGVTSIHLPTDYRIGAGRIVRGNEGWMSSMILPIEVGATRLLVPVTWEATAGGHWPTEDQLYRATIARLQERLDYPKRFLTGQRRAGDHLQGMNGEKSWIKEPFWTLA